MQRNSMTRFYVHGTKRQVRSGKSEWVLRLIGHAKEKLEPSPEEIWYCYGEFQFIFARYPEVKFHEGMPDFTKFDGRRSTFLVLDDLMSETNDIT